MVSVASAKAGMDDYHLINADHKHVCKPDSRTAQQYKLLMDKIKEWAPRAGNK